MKRAVHATYITNVAPTAATTAPLNILPKVAHTSTSSTTDGNRVKMVEKIVWVARTPRSITLESCPVRRSRWKLKSMRSTCAKVWCASLRETPCMHAVCEHPTLILIFRLIASPGSAAIVQRAANGCERVEYRLCVEQFCGQVKWSQALALHHYVSNSSQESCWSRRTGRGERSARRSQWHSAVRRETALVPQRGGQRGRCRPCQVALEA
jgi:hypothetical protein